MKAWVVTHKHGLDSRIYVLADTASKAKAMVHNSDYCEDAWYPEWRVRRVPELDGEALDFFDLTMKGFMTARCEVCRADIRKRDTSRWPNGFTALCKEHIRVELPPDKLRTIRDFQPYVGPNAVNMIWIGDDT